MAHYRPICLLHVTDGEMVTLHENDETSIRYRFVRLCWGSCLDGSVVSQCSVHVSGCSIDKPQPGLAALSDGYFT